MATRRQLVFQTKIKYTQSSAPRGKPEELACWERLHAVQLEVAGDKRAQAGEEKNRRNELQGIFLSLGEGRGVVQSPLCAVGLCVWGSCGKQTRRGWRGNECGFHWLSRDHNRRKYPSPVRMQSLWEGTTCSVLCYSLYAPTVKSRARPQKTLHAICHMQGGLSARLNLRDLYFQPQKIWVLVP